MISISEAKKLPEMLVLKKFVENNPGHIKQNVYDHSLKTLKAMRRLSRNKFMRLVALVHDVGKAKTMEKNGSQISYPNHDKAGTRIIASLNLGLPRKQHSLAVRMVGNHLIAFYSKNFVVEIRRKSRGFAREQMLLAIADLKGGDEYRISPRGFNRKLKLFKQALREVS